MKNLITAIILVLLPIFSYAQAPWDNIITTTDTDLYIDSTQIKRVDGLIYARIKTVYITPEVRDNYVNKIKKVFKKNLEKKIQKWNDFQYNITYGIYDCQNNRFKVLEVEDYDSNDKQIVKTKKKEDKATWIDVDLETVGDYMLFSICDYRPEPSVLNETTISSME